MLNLNLQSRHCGIYQKEFNAAIRSLSYEPRRCQASDSGKVVTCCLLGYLTCFLSIPFSTLTCLNNPRGQLSLSVWGNGQDVNESVTLSVTHMPLRNLPFGLSPKCNSLLFGLLFNIHNK